LLYHHVSGDREITPAGFERQLRYLSENGYSTPSMPDFITWMRGDKELPGKSVLLTFDDGYADNWICAWPLLKKYGLRAAVFVTTSKIGGFAPRPTIADGAAAPDTIRDERGEQGFLSWQELRLMVDSNVFDVGSHTHTHNNFDKRAAWVDMREELRKSSEIIKERLGVKPVSLAWPWGYFVPHFPGYAAEEGYTAMFTVRPGANVAGGDLRAIRRFKVQNENIGWLARRLWLYRQPALAELYGRAYGLDRKIKRLFL